MVKDSLDLWRDSLSTALTSMLQKIAVGSEDDGEWMERYGLEMKVNGADYSSFASSKSFEYPEEFINVAHPQEPNDLDRPIRCPPPEPCIVHDGRTWKERMLASSRGRNDLLGSMRELDHIEYYSTPPHRRRRSRSSESLLVPPLDTTDLVVTKIVD